MRKSLRLQLAAPIVCSLLIGACGGSDGANDDRQAQQPQTNVPEQSAQTVVALNGCVETGAGSSQYVLRNVRFASGNAADSQHNTTTPAAAGITEGSWVRLDAQGRDLASFAGQRVTMTGVVVDTGQNTIGTAGTEGVPTASGDRSRASADEHYSDKVQDEAGRLARESMANGTAARIRVNAMEGTGEKCVAK